jgi:hypothetical protein
MQAERLGGRVFGAALTAIGLVALFAGRDLPFGTLREPGAGFFPLTVATALMLFAVLSMIGRDSVAEEPSSLYGNEHETEYQTQHKTERTAVRAWMLAGLLALYAWLLPHAGFVLCTTVLLATVLGGLGSVRRMRAIVIAAVAAAGCWFLFTRLGMPLPRGLLAF